MLLFLALSWNVVGQPGEKPGPDFYALQDKILTCQFDEFFELESIKNKIEEQIQKTEGKLFYSDFLKKALGDLNTFKVQSNARKKEIKLKIEEFKNLSYRIRVLEGGEKDFANKNLDIIKKEIVDIFGEGSYLDLDLTIAKATILIPSKGKDVSELILNEIERLEKNGWKDSPYLNLFYILLSANYLGLEKYDKIISYEKILEKYRMMILDHDDEKNLVQISYKIISLSKLEKHEECISVYKTINKKWLESESYKLAGSVARANSAYAQSLFATGKKREAMSYQELSLALVAGIFDNKYHEDIIKEATLLRTMLADQGEWKSLRNLEERYKLKPLPKNPAEN